MIVPVHTPITSLTMTIIFRLSSLLVGIGQGLI